MAGGIVQTDNTRNNFFAGYAPWAELQQQQKTAQLNNQLLQQKMQQSAQQFPMEQQQLQQQLAMGQQQLQLAQQTQGFKVDESAARAQQAQALAENLKIINRHADAIEQAKQEASEMQNTLLKPRANLAGKFTDAALKLTLNDVTNSELSAAASKAQMKNVEREAELKAKNAEETSRQLAEQGKQTVLKTQGMGQQLVAEKISSFGAFANLMRTATDAERPMYARMVAEADPTLKYIQDIPPEAWDSLPQQLDKQIMGDKTLLGIKINRDLGLPPSGTQFGMIPDANGMPKFGDAFQRYTKPVADLAAKFSKIVTDRFNNNPQGQTVPPGQPAPVIKGATKGLQTSNTAVKSVEGQTAPTPSATATPVDEMIANVDNHIAQHQDVANRPMSSNAMTPIERRFVNGNPVPDFISQTVSPSMIFGSDEGTTGLNTNTLVQAGVIKKGKELESGIAGPEFNSGVLRKLSALNKYTDTEGTKYTAPDGTSVQAPGATLAQQVKYKALVNDIYRRWVNGVDPEEIHKFVGTVKDLTIGQKQQLNTLFDYLDKSNQVKWESK